MKPELTNALSLDCRTVSGRNGKNLLAQVVICNENGQCVYNYYVKQSDVADYKTGITGITPNHLQRGRRHRIVHREVADIIRGRILVGHDMNDGLRALGLGHPKWNKRDSAYYFRNGIGFPTLKDLARQHLGCIIQDGYRNAVEDARTIMRIYKVFEKEWEESENDDSECDTSENDGSEDGISENDGSENGSRENDGSENGTSENDGSENGSRENDGSEDDTSENGMGENNCSEDGISENDGSENYSSDYDSEEILPSFPYY